MRACFLGQNICALGFGVATLQTPPLRPDEDLASVRHGTEALSPASPWHASGRATRLLLPAPTAPTLPLIYAAQAPGAPVPCVKPVKSARNRE